MLRMNDRVPSEVMINEEYIPNGRQAVDKR